MFNFSEFLDYVQNSKWLFTFDISATVFGVVGYFFVPSDKIKLLKWTLIILFLLLIVSGGSYFFNGIHNLKAEFESIEEPEYNYKIEYPNYFKVEYYEPDSVHLIAKDKKASITISAKQYNTDVPSDFSIESAYLEHNNQNKVLELGSLKNKGWYVIAYESADTFYYQKCIAGDHIAKKFVFSFPLSQREYYNNTNANADIDYVDYIENSFRNLE
ncbi:MAG: hypothetical protein Q4D45_13030 [Lachnospiraceae bacterium]|nr:hypothetical protein [Lachnospiraceae bacterium]